MSLREHKAEWMAAELGVSRQTVSRWMSDKGAPPHRAYVRQWALLVGVSPEWLETGEVAEEGDGSPVSDPPHPAVLGRVG